MAKFCFLSVLFISTSISAQTEFFHSKINFSKDQLDKFYSSISIDGAQIYFNANDYTVYAHNTKTGILNWSHYSGNKSNNAPKTHQNNVFVESSGGKCEQLNAKTGELVQEISLEEFSTQPIIKDTIMYCAAVSPQIGGAILAYDLKNNHTVWQKYIGHGATLQPYFFKDKIVANYENQYWFELDYNGNALDKDSGCYYKTTEPPFEEQFCNIHYDLLNQYNKDILVKNVTIEETKYHYAKNATLILEGNILKIVNEKNKVKKEIVLNKIITPLETGINNYKEILKVEENTVWFIYENMLGVYDFKNNKTIKTLDLSKWNPHKAILNGNNVWLISRNDGELVGLKIE
ncbi:MAG TPA: PQQ-binding-like beta-propeller repeat protein [Flavobacterium sp.]|uniref:outer membrane protein assembly factor BamB family protein n=1 Tax=Flavobacterium sp. TaxID=239 RepID=UPI002CDE9463|nr:PQQ-binding-like beta-propeller repeat protein [Flavobacterium sp.]HSD14394.1 PQQ-binding-like beta-propeller repeat protein [Flavobacterium sp.]